MKDLIKHTLDKLTRIFNIIRLWFKRRKAKENLKMAKYGGRLIMDMYTESEIKTKGSIAQSMFKDHCNNIDKAQEELNIIQNEYQRTKKLNKIL